MARKQRPEEDGGTWMNTYSDLVTLLMTFFVLLFSMSSVNAEKWEQFVKAFANPGDDTSQVVIDLNEKEPGDAPLPDQSTGEQLSESLPEGEELPPIPVDFSDLYAYFKEYVEEKGLESSIEVFEGGENVVYIRFQNNIFFEPDRYYLRSSAYEVLDFVGDCLHGVEDQIYIITINGHTASVPYETGVSDWMLSGQRASSVAIYFEHNKGINPQKLRPMGYGENFPAASNDTAEGREENRRVDMVIVRSNENGDSALLKEELVNLFDPSQFPRTGGTTDLLTPPSGDAGTNVGGEPIVEPPVEPPAGLPVETPVEPIEGLPTEPPAEPPANVG